MAAPAISCCRYKPEQHLEAAIEATGHKLGDVKAIIMGHLHMDHAGGLELFRVSSHCKNGRSRIILNHC
jgi:glyoxylase-like metal-dependent hydrolase (beta-lactamase superfamily II)